VYRGSNLRSDKPVMRTRSTSRLLRPRRRWDQVTWWFSLLFVVPMLLISADALFGLGPDRGSDHVNFKVSDAATGAAIPGATVALGAEVARTDDQGKVSFDRPRSDTVVQVVMSGFQSTYGSFDNDHSGDQRVALRPVSVASASETIVPTATSAASSEEAEQPITTETALPTLTTPANSSDAGDVGSGRVVDAQGEPIAEALVATGDAFTRTDKNGEFSLDDAVVADELIVNAPGYARQVLPAASGMEITLERLDIKAAYLNGNRAGDDEFVDGLIDLIGRTELNAVVIDIKENIIFYDTKVQFFIDAEAVAPTYDAAALVKKFKDAGIYTIARQVVFKDPLIAEAYPELAVKDEAAGGVWRGWQGEAWVNPFQQELWQPNIDMALEAIGFGFDEVQYDYIRFPSDGDLSTADFGPHYDEENRVATIVEFLSQTREAIAPTGAMLAVDIFGIVAIYPDDQGIGQRLADIAPVVDYVCPMIYPSHFDATSIDVGGEPNALPYETISLSVELALDKMPDMDLKLRPWLQDFTLGEPEYGPEEVRAQIDAAEELDGSGWLLWNAASDFTEDALDPA
jgi:hypothetical protein